MQRTGESRVQTRQRLVAFLAVLLTTSALLIVTGQSEPAQAAGSSCGPTINSIVCENSKPGTDPSVWDIDGAGDESIQGFATDISVNAGNRIDFKVDTSARAYTIDIYRTGWYQGKGARFIQSVPVSASLPQTQPQCITDVSTELYDCGTWKVSASWTVPSTAISGVYVAKLTRGDTRGASHITFIVRNDASRSDVVFQTSDPTWQAYNTYGGSDFYQGAANGRAYKISYNRPVVTRGLSSGRDFYFSAEYATVRFLERNGYDMTYISGVDTDRFGSQLLNHKVFLSVGHDEYWSGAQRKNVEAARDAGVNLQFLSGNEIYWRTRYEASADTSKTAYRTLVSYKETWANAKIDPSSEWTGTWRDPRFSTAANGGASPENALTGTMYFVNDDDLAVTVNSEEGKLRLWRNTSLTSLATGTKAALAPHTVGYESDEDADNGFRPAGLIRLSTTVGPTPQYLTDYGNVVVPGTTEHHLTMYRAASGALVFGAGTIQWGWGLDQQHDGDGAPADARMQQAQVNLLADMGAQPGSLMSGLVAATKSTDTTAPVTTISSPTAGQKIAHGASTTITGTATDAGGRVAGVEVSVDGGKTWHPAKGTTNWSYSYVQQGSGTTALLARAVDDSGNFAAAGTSRSVDVTGPFTVWGAKTPARPSASDTQAVELGLRFTPSTDGYADGVRFYKGTANTGIHTGTLWSADGQPLASVQFNNETASGWQTALFSTPVSVSAGVSYVVSYTAPKGGYAYEENYWPYKASPSAPLEVASGVGAASPGVYGAPGQFPTRTYGDANYYVDISFTSAASSPPTVVARTPLATSTSNPLSTTVTARFNKEVISSSAGLTLTAGDGTTVSGTAGYDATTRTVTFTPSAALAPGTKYTATPRATDLNGGVLAADAAWTFVTQTADLPSGTCPCTLFSESARPMVDADPDTVLVTLGVKITPTVDGRITAVKYFKGTKNGGSHAGALWSASGAKLASVTFADDSAYGWQTAKLSSPVAVKAGQTYVASYTAAQGGYSSSAGQFASAYARGPLTVPASGAVYTYANAFPTSTSTASYLVDVVFEATAPGPTLVTTTPVTGAVEVAQTAAVSATFSAPISATFTGAVTANGTPVAGSWSRSSDMRSAVFTPAAALPTSASVIVSLTGVTGAQGGDVADTNWSFVVAAANGSPTQTLLGSVAPQVASDVDTASVELGMAFHASAPGQVTAIRFYKGVGNTGTHTGSLWGPNGELLATVTFGNESAAGWQRAALSTPVALKAGTVYTVSYLAPNGRYSYTSAGFATPVSSGVLAAETSDNGVYRYGTGGAMPTSTWNSTNYFVDIEFAPDVTPPAVVAASPSRGAQDVLVGAIVSAQFDRDVAGAAPGMFFKTSAGAAVAGAVSYDANSRSVSFAPAAALAPATGYRVSVVLNGIEVDTWNFTTAPAAQQGTAATLFGNNAPATAATADSGAIEVGTAFRVTEAGTATAIRFYKGTGNTGTHIGTLWSSDGVALGRVTFSAESATGWQRAPLATPIALDPSKTYVVSYYAPKGHYASTASYFASERVNGNVVGLAPANGLYRYGAGGGFPTLSWNSSAYFVDAEVVFPSTQ